MRLASISKSSKARYLAQNLKVNLETACRVGWYSSSSPRFEDVSVATKKKEERSQQDLAARVRASYKREVSRLRKEYMDEYLLNKAQDEAVRDAEMAEIRRRRLERQRAKNIRSAENATRQAELRRQTHLAFQDHLRQQQEIRDARKNLMRRARQLVIDELEEEAPLWLTTSEEIEAAFSHSNEQLLWSRPNGVIGVPNPSLDSHFWQYECHTWHMPKTYKTQREILLEELEEQAYEKANIDPKFWNETRLQEREELERKAKLRAMVRWEGRKALLRRQKQSLDEISQPEQGEPPRPMSVPSLGVLSNVSAQEKEGSKMLMNDPTAFFLFDRSSETNNTDDVDSKYEGPSLGVPIGLRDPLRTGSPQGRVFPRGVGKLPKPDTRSEREKKRQEREEKLWAAAQVQARTEQDEIDMAADEDMDIGEPLDYDNNDDWDPDDEEWMKGLDPEKDADLINTPRELRYREEDIEWVAEQLKGKVEQIQRNLRNIVNVMQQDSRPRKERRELESLEVAGDRTEESDPLLDDPTLEKLAEAGVDAEELESFVSSLSEEQLFSLLQMDIESLGSPEQSDVSDSEMTRDIAEKYPDFSEEQIAQFVAINRKLLRVEEDEEIPS